MTIAGTRVLRAHIDAAKAALHDNLPAFFDKTLSGEDFARRIAEAVVAATDGQKTYYCVGVRQADGNAMIYGPLATHAAAQKVIARGDVLSQPGAKAGVWPLLPPGKPEKKKEKK